MKNISFALSDCTRKVDHNHPIGDFGFRISDCGFKKRMVALWWEQLRQSEQGHSCARGSLGHLVGAGPCACPDFGQPQGVSPTIHLFNSEIRIPKSEIPLKGGCPYNSSFQFRNPKCLYCLVGDAVWSANAPLTSSLISFIILQ